MTTTAFERNEISKVLRNPWVSPVPLDAIYPCSIVGIQRLRVRRALNLGAGPASGPALGFSLSQRDWLPNPGIARNELRRVLRHGVPTSTGLRRVVSCDNAAPQNLTSGRRKCSLAGYQIMPSAEGLPLPINNIYERMAKTAWLPK